MSALQGEEDHVELFLEVGGENITQCADRTLVDGEKALPAGVVQGRLPDLVEHRSGHRRDPDQLRRLGDVRAVVFRLVLRWERRRFISSIIHAFVTDEIWLLRTDAKMIMLASFCLPHFCRWFSTKGIEIPVGQLSLD